MNTDMVPTKIELTDRVPQWGLVTVTDDAGVLDRSYAITAEEELAVRLDGGHPPGCTREEWESGRVSVSGRPCLAGQAMANPDGWLMVNMGIEHTEKEVLVKLFRVPPEDWTLENGVVMLSASASQTVLGA